MSGVPRSVSELVKEVERLLAGDGSERAKHLTGVLQDVLDREESIAHLKRLGRRKGVAFYLAAGRVKPQGLKVDVRIAGRSCGEISLAGRTDRHFAPKNFHTFWDDPASHLPWNTRTVRAYLEKVAEEIRQTKQNIDEAWIESALLVHLSQGLRREKPEPLWEQQAVELGGLPFQFPLPITGSSRGIPLVAKGNQAGHADVIAKHRDRRLRVFEIKAPRAAAVAVDHALAQAVIYAATLRKLLEGSYEIYRPILNCSPRRKDARIDAVAVVHEKDFERVRRSVTHLRPEHGPFDLYVMGYTLDARGGVEITREEPLGKGRC